jgi:hypothetical protein
VSELLLPSLRGTEEKEQAKRKKKLNLGRGFKTLLFSNGLVLNITSLKKKTRKERRSSRKHKHIPAVPHTY